MTSTTAKQKKKKPKKPRKKASAKSSSLLSSSKPEPKAKAKAKAKKQSKKKTAPKAAKKSPKAKTKKKSTSAKALRPAVIGDSLSCGVLLFQRGPVPLVLVLWRKDGSPDLPKGHTKPGETDVAAALRELHEETDIAASRLTFTPGFVFENTYRTKSKKIPGALVNKTVRVFHAEIDGPVVVVPHEHAGYAWLNASDLRAAQHDVHDNPTFAGALRAWRHHLQRQQA